MNLRRTVRAVQVFLKQRGDVFDLRGLPDPRRRRGRRWSLHTLVRTALLALCTCARSLRVAERLSADLPGVPRRVPDSTLGDLLARLAPRPLRTRLHDAVRAEHRRKALAPTVLPIGAISIDGKCLATVDAAYNDYCQQQQQDGQPPVWLYRAVRATLISSAAAVCLDQQPIPARTNEQGVFARFFAALQRTYGRSDLYELVMADAGFCAEVNGRLIDAAGKAYVLRLKSTQPDLEREAQRVLVAGAAAPEAVTPWEHDSSRGTIQRQLWRTAELAGWGRWTHLRQVWLVRVVRRGGDGAADEVIEERWYATNLPWARLDGTTILALVRAHWRIENDCFGTLDLQWQEDHGRWVRRGHGLEVVSLLRLLAYNLLALLRAQHLRGDAGRRAAWSQLRDWVRDALVWPATPAVEATTPGA